MLPVLYDGKSTSWESFGIGVLSDAMSCEVEENRNGSYELEMSYPVSGAYYNQIQLRNLIVAKPNYTDEPQPFRIYSISKPLNGIVTINAEHISYDLAGYALAPFSASGIQAALRQIINPNIVYPAECPFTFTSDMSGQQNIKLDHPVNLRSMLGGIRGSLIDVFGGEWHFDGLSCDLKASRGEDRGVTIRYGKDLTDLRQEENNSEVWTAVYPYYYDSNTEELVTIPEKTVAADGTFEFSRVLTLDLTSEFSETPTEQELREAAQKYIDNNAIGIPKVNLTIGFLQMDSLPDRVDLCDTVTVEFDKLGVSARAKCIRTKWDVLKGRYTEAELGSARNSLAKTIAGTKEVQQAIEEHSSEFRFIANNVASKVTGNRGGYIILHDTDGDGEPDEILVMDRDDISTAVKVIRINNSGIAFSSNGYYGTYKTAWNIDGEFVADFIAAGELRADLVSIIGDANYKWDASNIEIIDPNNANRIIRFGKYDGTNYGIGFSIDGGTNWISGFDFNGITMIGNVRNDLRIGLLTNRIYMADENNVSVFTAGKVNAHDVDGTEGTYTIYRLGSWKATDREGNSYTHAQAHGMYSFSAGGSALPAGAYSAAIGYDCESIGNYSTAAGYKNTTSGELSFAVGARNKSSGTGSVSMGIDCEASGYCATALGKDSSAKGNYSLAEGKGCEAGGGYSVAMGCESWAAGAAAVALGNDCKASSGGAVALGKGNYAQGSESAAIGYENTASGLNAVAMGGRNTASGMDAIALGYKNEATGAESVALGRQNEASGTSALSLGYSNKATKSYSIALGYNNQSTGNADNDATCVTIGYENRSTNNCAFALGSQNIASGMYAFALGHNLRAISASSFVCGAYNSGVNKLFVIGNGSSSARSNAVEVDYSGNMKISGSLTQSSDGRLKDIVGDIPQLNSIKAVLYKWNDKKQNRDDILHIGYIAQEVEKVAPYLVEDEVDGYKALDYIGLLCAKVDLLERTVERLTQRIEELERKEA